MNDKRQFVEALLKYQVLQFGDFETKSGRQSPYFFNTGNFACSESMAVVAQLYAQAIYQRFGKKVRHLFGPAYKGIPLAVMVADRLAQLIGQPVYFTFNRKEAKGHGEKGLLVGYPYQGGEEVLIVEDVLTGGTSIRESLALLAGSQIKLLAAVVGIDRQERGQGAVSARQEIEGEYKLPIVSLITLEEIIGILAKEPILGRKWLDGARMAKIEAYLDAYGVRTEV